MSWIVFQVLCKSLSNYRWLTELTVVAEFTVLFRNPPDRYYLVCYRYSSNPYVRCQPMEDMLDVWTGFSNWTHLLEALHSPLCSNAGNVTMNALLTADDISELFPGCIRSLCFGLDYHVSLQVCKYSTLVEVLDLGSCVSKSPWHWTWLQCVKNSDRSETIQITLDIQKDYLTHYRNTTRRIIYHFSP